MISQHPAISPPLPSDSRPSSSVGHAFFSMLQSALQTNILQRVCFRLRLSINLFIFLDSLKFIFFSFLFSLQDCILSLMKQVSVGDSTGFCRWCILNSYFIFFIWYSDLPCLATRADIGCISTNITCMEKSLVRTCFAYLCIWAAIYPHSILHSILKLNYCADLYYVLLDLECEVNIYIFSHCFSSWRQLKTGRRIYFVK